MERDSTNVAMYETWRAWVRSGRPRCATGSVLKRALLISYEFPPIGGSGVQRAAKLAKYLPEFGWSLHMLTAAHDRFSWHDETLLVDLPPDCEIHRVRGNEPACLARRIVTPLRFAGQSARQWLEDRIYEGLVRWAARRGQGNGEIWWVRSAVHAALKLHQLHRYDAVISTGPPHFTHLIAREMSATAGIPWLADLREPLTSDLALTPHSRTEQIAQNRLEAKILSEARAIVTATAALTNDLQHRYPQRATAIRCITNGFDRDDFLRHEHLDAVEPCQSECLLLASGSFYGRRELRRVLWPLERVLIAHPEWDGLVRLVVAGTVDAQQQQRIERHRPDWLTMLGYVDHVRAVELAMRATCSIVMVPDCEHGRLSIPSKIFELIGLPRHILGLMPAACETGLILRRACACTLAPLENEAAVEGALAGIIAAHFSDRLPRERPWRSLDPFDRQNIAHEFAECLDSLCGIRRDFLLCRQAQREADLVLARLSLTAPPSICSDDPVADEIRLDLK